MIIFLILIPLLGASLSFLIKDSFRYIAVLSTILTFILSVFMTAGFNLTAQGFHFIEHITINNHVITFGLDGISLIFVLLTTFLSVVCTVMNWHKSAGYIALFLLLESIIIALFSSLNIISFYVFFEASLIPMFFIIGIWGSDNRIYATFKFFLYTLAGSVAFLIAIIYLYTNGYSTDIVTLQQTAKALPFSVQKLLWFALFIACAVKIPMVPFHTWLPDAHVQAPTAGSVMLAGILIKMGAYGLLRLAIPIFPEVSQHYANMIFILSIVAVIYTSLVALVQTDIKKMIAYSSIAHMGFVTAGIFSFNEQGISGAIFQMFSHGIISSALFACVGMIYDRKHSRNIADYSGLANVMPWYSFAFIIFSMASIGLPGTSGFIGEFLSLVGVFKASKITAAFIGTGIILGAAYMLWLCKRIIWSKVNANVQDMMDINTSEKMILFSLLALTIILGLQPQLIMVFIEVPVHNLVNLIYK